MKDSKFDIAAKKADEVLGRITIDPERKVDIEQVVQVVQEISDTDIDVRETDFDDIISGCNYGAMMCVTNARDNRHKALIVLNSNEKIDTKFRRFSLAHELGHLVTNKYTISTSDNSFTISTHIHYKFSEISSEDYEKSEELLNEEIANVFALKVLMPFEQLYSKIISVKDIPKIAEFFGLKEEAIKSRLMLGA